METLVEYKDKHYTAKDGLFVAKFEEHEGDTYSIYAKDEEHGLLLIAKLFCDGNFYLTSTSEVELEFDDLVRLHDFVGGLRIDFALEYEN